MTCPTSSALTLVQSIPVGNFNVSLQKCAEPTWTVLRDLVKGSSKKLDATAMYMDLLGTDDRKVFSPAAMKAFGADRGSELFDSLQNAAKRGITIRLLLGTLNNPINSTEVRTLLGYGAHVQARAWDPRLWYKGGIMHAKMWIADDKQAYMGSANADWKSLAQVKELGVAIDGGRAPDALGELASLFDVFWSWASPDSVAHATSVQAYSPVYQASLSVPPWDPLVPSASRAPSPFAATPPSRFDIAKPFDLGGGASGFVSAAPAGALTGVRVPDEDALVYAIRDATTSASLSVMDFLPASDYEGGHGGAPLYWPVLIDAMIAAVYAKPLTMRLLVSHWEHTSKSQVAAMRRLADAQASCALYYQKCAGTLEVRQFYVPGWNDTASARALSGEQPSWPSYSRVNHAKYIVTDRRVNVGTSNWQWGYFHNTAGASLNTNDTALRTAAQAAFDDDWESSYAVPLD